MTRYWRIGQLVLGIYIAVQAMIFAVSKLEISTEAIQSTGQTLLSAHLQQRIPGYYYTVSKTTDVWEALPASLGEAGRNSLVETLLPGKTVTILDSAFVSGDLTNFRWLKIAFDGADQSEQIGWMLAQNP